MKTANILTICCQHGNERFGMLVGFELLKRGEPVVVGNPRAFIKGTRFFDTDSRRTMFISEGGNYDSKQFERLIQLCSEYDLVIDIHTTYSSVGEVAIIGENNDELIRLAGALDVDRVAVMPHSIFANALGGHISSRIISLEYGADYEQTEETAKDLAERIIRMKATKRSRSIRVLHITGTITTEFAKTGLQNYEYSAAIGGYPFLVGETSYKTHAGFFADRRETVIIGDRHD